MIFPLHCRFIIFFSNSPLTQFASVYRLLFFFSLFWQQKRQSFSKTPLVVACDGDLISDVLSHETSFFLSDLRLIYLNASRLRQSIETAVTTNVKATFSVNRTWKFKITVFDSKAFPCFQSFRTFQKWFFIKQCDMLFAFISSVMKWATAY